MISTTFDARLLRRVVRLRRLVAGPLAMGNEISHDPVMVEEVLAAMNLTPGATVVDCTLGLGGHSSQFIEAVAPGGTLIGMEWDESMLVRARARIGEPEGVRVHLVHSDFRALYPLLLQLGLKADGILLDLGLNSAQVDDGSRGMSFLRPGPLDARMDRSKGEPASALLNRMTPAEIERALVEFGDERWARRIARCIVERRRNQPLRTTEDLVDCVLAAIPVGAREKRIHPATRTFQAIRILVNRELEGLDEALRGAATSLAPGGTMVVLSYHSGEDRIVKQVFRELAQEGYVDVYKKPLVPTSEEIRKNSRSRSAKMRALRCPAPL